MSRVKKKQKYKQLNILEINQYGTASAGHFDFSNVTIFPNETTISPGIKIMMGIISSDVSRKGKLFHRG